MLAPPIPKCLVSWQYVDLAELLPDPPGTKVGNSWPQAGGPDSVPEDDAGRGVRCMPHLWASAEATFKERSWWA